MTVVWKPYHWYATENRSHNSSQKGFFVTSVGRLHTSFFDGSFSPKCNTTSISGREAYCRLLIGYFFVWSHTFVSQWTKCMRVPAAQCSALAAPSINKDKRACNRGVKSNLEKRHHPDRLCDHLYLWFFQSAHFSSSCSPHSSLFSLTPLLSMDK